MPNTEEEEFLLGIQYRIHQHSWDELKVTSETRVNCCYFCQTSMRAVAAHSIFRMVSQTDLLKLYFSKSVVGLLFLFHYIAVPTPKAWE